MNKLPLALWLLGWFPACNLTDALQKIATGQNTNKWSDDSTGMALLIWIVGAAILYPWGDK